MNIFGRKSAGRDLSRPALARGFSFGWARTEAPATYEAQVRAAYMGNPIAQRAVRIVTEAVGNAPVSASDPAALALVAARTGGQALIETVALHLLLHGNAFVQVSGDTLFALRPERVTVETDARGWPVAYLYRAGERTARLLAEDASGGVIHVKAAHPIDDHYGLGSLGAAAGAVAIHNAATVWNRALLDNAARPSGALVYDPGDGSTLSAEQFERLSAATAASFAGLYGTIPYWFVGNGAGLGGFLAVFRFSPSDQAPVSGARMFVGLSSTTSAPTNVEPATLTNQIGVAQLSTSANLAIVYGGTTAQAAIDLGASFPAGGLTTDLYELTLVSDAGDNSRVGYRVERLNTGDVATGFLANTTPGTTLPATNVVLAQRMWRTNNATALAVGFDLASATVVWDF